MSSYRLRSTPASTWSRITKWGASRTRERDLPDAKHPFAKGHELGHAVIPWHESVLYACDEHDLSPQARAQLEFEANAFASEILVPKELLKTVYEQYPISMETVLQIRNWCGASIQAAANAYVKHHPQKCLLLVFEEIQKEGGPVLRLTQKVVSDPASKSSMSTLARQQEVGTQHVLWMESRSTHRVTTTELTITNTTKRLKVSLLNNRYRVLALVYD